MDVAYINHGGTGLRCPFIILAVAPIATIPGVGTLHHPAFLQGRETFGPFWTSLHFDSPIWALLCHPCVESMIVILAIGKDRFETWKVLRIDLLEQLRGRHAIIQPRTCDQQGHQQAHGINHQMPLAPFDLLTAIIATLGTAHLRRFDGLAVDACGAWGWLPTRLLAGLFSQCLKHLGPRAMVTPPRKVVVHGTLGE